ncbi:unnamed protein product, partial [Arabidopsis halleri]
GHICNKNEEIRNLFDSGGDIGESSPSYKLSKNKIKDTKKQKGKSFLRTLTFPLFL